MKGICYNKECSLKGKIQNIDNYDEFECRECGSRLFMPPKSFGKKITQFLFSKIGIFSIIVILLLIGIVFYILSADFTPPKKPKVKSIPTIVVKNNKIQKNHAELLVRGEVGSKVYLNSKDTSKVIPKEGSVKLPVSVNLSNIDKKFTISLKDNAGNESEKFSFNFKKKVIDTIPPKKPVITSLPTTTEKDEVIVEVKGEENAKVYLNDEDTGKRLKKGKTSIALDTSGEPGIKKFSIYLEDNASNKSEKLNFSIAKKDITPPKKPVIGTQTGELKVICNKLKIQIKGEPNSYLFINGESKGKLSKNGDIEVELDVVKNKQEFKFILKDEAGNESEPYIAYVDKSNDTKIINDNGFNFVFVPNCKQEVKFNIKPFVGERYKEKYVETKKPFFIQTVPVTVKAFRKFVKDTSYQPTLKTWDKYPDETNGELKDAKDNFPVTNVSLDDINAYIEWFNEKTGQKYRLPTLKEWVMTINNYFYDSQKHSYREEVDINSTKVRNFVTNLFEFSSTECGNGRFFLLASDYVTDYNENIGNVNCENKASYYITFRLVREAE